MSRRLLPWIVLVVFALGYPLVVLGGGGPRFPSRGDCVRPATSDQNIEAVFGRFGTTAVAESMQRRAARSGFKNVQVESDEDALALDVRLPDRARPPHPA